MTAVDVPLIEPLTKEWFKGYAERRDLELILATDANVTAHVLALKLSEVTPALTVRSTEPDGETFIAILYRRPVPLVAAAARLTQLHAS